jgi:cytochrome P450 family 6
MSAETLRKYPPLPLLDRICLQDYKVPERDLIIEKNTPVYIALLGLHRDPEYYPDPEHYDPERFTEENKRLQTPYTYLPFGDGPHNCIGDCFISLFFIMNLTSDFLYHRDNKDIRCYYIEK